MSGSYKAYGAELIAALMKSPRTIRELAEFMGANPKSGAQEQGISRWLQELHKSGVIYVKGGRQRRGRYAAVYAMQPALFANRDNSLREPA